MRLTWLIDALSGIGVAISALCGAALLWEISATSVYLLQHSPVNIGAVSVGLPEAVLVGLAACVLANRVLAGPARRSGGLLLALHRSHSGAFVLAIGLLALTILILFASVIPWTILIAAFVLIGVLFAVQFFLLAMALVVFIWRRRMTLERSRSQSGL